MTFDGSKLHKLRVEAGLGITSHFLRVWYASSGRCTARQTLDKWENNKRQPTIDELVDLASLFKVDTSFFLSGNHSKRNGIK